MVTMLRVQRALVCVSITIIGIYHTGCAARSGTSDLEAWSWQVPEDMVTSLAFAPDGNTIAAGTYGGSVWLCSVSSRAITTRVHVAPDPVIWVGILPESSAVLTHSADRRIRCWDTDTGTCRYELTGEAGLAGCHVALSRDGKYVMSATKDGPVLWNATNGTRLRSFKGHRHVYCVAFSANNAYALSASLYSIRVWQIATGEEVAVRKVKGGRVLAAAGTSVDQRFLIGAVDGIMLWDVVTGERLAYFGGEAWPYRECTFSADGSRAVLLHGHEAHVLDTASREEIQHFTRQHGYFHAVALSPDGQQIASGGVGEVRLWDVTTGREVHRFVPPSDK